MRTAAAIILGIWCAGCQQEHLARPMTVHQSRQAMLDEIAGKCHIHRDIFHLVGDAQLEFRPNANDQYERVDCALSAVNKPGSPFELGFVGNESFARNEQ